MPLSSPAKKFIIKPQTFVNLSGIDPAHNAFHLEYTDLPEGEHHVENGQPMPAEEAYDKLIVVPGRRVRLGEIDPGYQHGYESREVAVVQTRALLRKMDRLQ